MTRLVSTLIVGLALLPGTAIAQSVVTFQYDTLIDTTPVGGSPDTPLRATYSFASDLLPGSGPFGTTPAAAAYGPISLTLQVGAETVMVSGPGYAIGIGVFNDAGTSIVEDGFGVTSYSEATYSGQLFGFDVQLIAINIGDSDRDMFSSTALPLTPDFVTSADWSYVDILLTNSLGEGLQLSNFGQGAPFSLVVPSLPPPICSSTVTSVPGLRSEVDALSTSNGTKNALKALLDEVQAALDLDSNDDARNGMAPFIRSVIHRSTREESQRGRIPLSEANHLVCSASNVLIGIPGQ